MQNPNIELTKLLLNWKLLRIHIKGQLYILMNILMNLTCPDFFISLSFRRLQMMAQVVIGVSRWKILEQQHMLLAWAFNGLYYRCSSEEEKKSDALGGVR